MLKIVLWVYLGAILADWCKFWNGGEKSHAYISRLTTMAIFANSRWRMAAMFIIALSQYISAVKYPISIKFGTQILIFIPSMQIWQKNRKFSNSRWRTDAILKIVFWLYLGAILADQREIWNRDEGSHPDVFSVTKTAIFANSKIGRASCRERV